MKRGVLTLLLIVVAASVSAQGPPDSAYVIPSYLTFESEPVLYPTTFPVYLEDTVYLGSTNAPAAYTSYVKGGPGIFSVAQPTGYTNCWFVVSACINYLEVGTYIDTVVITVAGISEPVILPVELEIVPDSTYLDSAYVTPTLQYFTAEQGVNQTQDGSLFVYSLPDGAPFTVSLLHEANFVYFDESNGVTNDSVTFEVRSTTDMSSGIYSDTLIIDIEDYYTPLVSVVYLTIEETSTADSAWVEPTNMSFTIPSGADSSFLVVVAVHSTNAPASYSCYPAPGSNSFVSIFSSRYVTPDTLILEIDASSLAAGFHSASVICDVAGCDNSPEVEILLEITPADSTHRRIRNKPNPFNPSTTIYFTLKSASDVKLNVFDILGRKVACLHSGWLSAGDHQVVWNGTNSSGQQVGSGVYLYRLKQGDEVETNKMMLIK